MSSWIAVGIAVAVAALFSLAELAIVSASRLRLRHWVSEAMQAGGRAAAEVVERPYRLLSPILVGHTLTVTVAAMATAGALAPEGEPEGSGIVALAGLASVALVPPLYLLGEAMPRAIARARAHQLFPGVALVLRVGAWVFKPLVVVGDAVARWLIRRRGSDAEVRAATGRRNLEALLVESERVGVVEPAEREIIAGVFEFGRTPARSVLTPAERMVAAPADAPAGEIARLIRETGFSRIPLRDERTDEVVGFVHVFDLMRLDPGERPRPRRVVRAGPETPCDELLLTMKRRRCHIAVVIEEGRTAGMVTLEDLVEELVGEIRDEHDARLEGGADSADSFAVDASTPAAQIEEERGVDLAGAATVADFVVGQLGRVPRPGESFVWDDWTVEAVDATPRRLRRVRFRRRRRPPPESPS